MISSAFFCLGWGWEEWAGSGSYRQKAEEKGTGRVDLTDYKNSQEFCKLVDKHGHP